MSIGGVLTMRRPRKRLTILIVEDKPEILDKLIVHTAKEFGKKAHIFGAMTFKSAEEIINRNFIDMAIIDLQLPDGDGEDLIALIRTYAYYLHILVQTVRDSAEYQAKIHNKYGNLLFLPKNRLFEELSEQLTIAEGRYQLVKPIQLVIKNGEKFKALDALDVCYATKAGRSNDIHLELYDYEKKEYTFTTIKNMALIDFMSIHNDSGYFVRCHDSYIVNIKLVSEISRKDNELTLFAPNKAGNAVKLNISQKYRKNVKDMLEGLAKLKK